MSNFQATTCKPHSRIIVKKPIASLGSTCQYPLYSHALGFHTLQEKVYPRLVLISASHKRLTSVCALSGKGSSGTADDVSSFYGLTFMLDISYKFILQKCTAVLFS
jgi:hypothetical protein